MSAFSHQGPRYAELQVTSQFSFLRGASSAEDLFATAALMGIEALAVVDRNSLAGMVRAHEAAKATGVRLIVGCRLDLACGLSVLVYPTDRVAYARLCRLLTLGKGRAGKGKCHLEWGDLVAYGEGLIAVFVPDDPDEDCAFRLRCLRDAFADRAYLALTLRRRPNDQMRLWQLSQLAQRAGVPTVVTNDVLFHEPARRMLQDVVTAIRYNTTIDQLGFRRERHADRYLKPPAEMHRLFARWPEALARTLEVARRCTFDLGQLAYQYPEERADPTLTPQETLERLTWEGAAHRYPEGVPEEVAASLRHELTLIGKLDYAPYFLTVNSIVRFARSRGILCQGRGSAANSAVCYVLGITAIDPGRNDLLFERFISEERHEPPDIDVDFEHERREEVIQWVYENYGRDRAALTATVTRYRSKGALRDVGKAMGLPEDLIQSLSGQLPGWSENGVSDQQIRELNLNPDDRRLRLTLELAAQLRGAPRHLSQHPGGFVLTHDRLDDLVPIEPAAMADRQIIEWDKDDIDALRFMKVDVLALGMLTCMRKGLDLIAAHKGITLDLATIPAEDPRTYAMIRKADTLGTFQIESRAQMSMLPRLKPRTYYDLVVQVAIVRPGPIQGDMVHPYLRRREGLEQVEYPRPELEKVLGKTLGVPLFQEQAMRVAIECAGFTPGEADLLRKSMATFKHTGGVSKFRDKMIDGMVSNGYEQDFAERKRTELSDDVRRALHDDIAASRDEFSRSFRALAKLVPPAEQQEDRDIFIAFLEGEVALQTNRLQWLENRTSTLIPASEFGPTTALVDDAMQRLGFAGRDCQLIAQDVDIPEDRRTFVRKAAAACTEIVVRRSEQDHEGNRDIVLAGLVDAHRGALDLPRPELDAALKAAEAEWQMSFQQLSDIPAQLAPDGESWTRFLQLFQQMAEVQRSRLLVLHSADEDPSAAYKAVRSPIMDVELSALGLENTDCRSIHF